MAWKTTIKKSRAAKQEGKAPTTQAGPFVKEEVEHVRRGKHGARSTKQAIAIGLSKARRAGVKLPKPKRGRVSARTERSVESAERRRGKKASPRRARAASGALKREGRGAASRPALSRQGRSAARSRTAGERSEAARKAARTRARKRAA